MRVMKAAQCYRGGNYTHTNVRFLETYDDPETKNSPINVLRSTQLLNNNPLPLLPDPLPITNGKLYKHTAHALILIKIFDNIDDALCGRITR